MNVRTICYCFLAAAPLYLAGCGLGQTDTPMPPWAADMSVKIDKVQQTLEQKADRDQLEVVKADLTKARRDVNKNKANLKAAVEVFKEQDVLLGDLARENKSLLAMLQQQASEQETLLAAVTKKDNHGAPMIDIEAIMDNDTGRQEMASAVHESMRRDGKLTVENQTDVGYTLQINGINGFSKYIWPRSKPKPFKVPVGTLTTELVDHESPKNWVIAPPNYEQRLVIAPAVNQSVIRHTPAVRHYYYDSLGGWVAYSP